MSRSEPNSRNEARDAGVLVFGRFVAMLAEVALPFVIARMLGKADVGAWSGLMLIHNTLANVLTAGFPAAMLYYMAGRSDEQRTAIARRLYATVMVLGVMIGGVLLLVGLFGDQALASFGKWVSGDEGEPAELHALRYLALYPVFDVLARVFPNYMISLGRARTSAAFGVLRAIGMTAGALIPATLGLGLPGMVMGLTLFSVVQAIGIGRVVREQQQGVERVEAEVSVGEMLRFSYPLGLTDMINVLNQAVDRYAILLLFSAEALADYHNGAWQIPVTAIAYSVGHVYVPRFVELIKQGQSEEAVELWRESIHKVSLIVVPVCMVFAVGAEEFITVGFTAEYLGAAPVFRAYTIYTMARVASFGALILATGRSKLLLRAAGFSLLSNLAITGSLVFVIGFLGPAIGTALAFIPTVALYCYYIARALEVEMRKTFPVLHWLGVVALSTIAAGPAIALKLWVPMHPALALLAYAVTTVPCFVVIARLSGVMTAADLAFAVRWLRLEFLFERKSEKVLSNEPPDEL
ncbi:MAG: oligosaccharide flippase family protein [Enhygromyxa sp.]